MTGTITVNALSGGSNTYNLNISNTNAPTSYRMQGNDRSGSIALATPNPGITVNVGDTLNFILDETSTDYSFAIQKTQDVGGNYQGHIAFCGRTTGNLSGTGNIGGYDLFLGIFDPERWTAEYYNQGSGFNDKAMNVHDIHGTIDDTLALVYTSFGSVNNSATFGSEDIGLITFNYMTDTWSQGFSTGSETSEEIEQNGKPSSRLSDGRIGVVCNTAGAFADDANTFGLKDMGLGIFDFDSDGFGNYAGWSKYQVGSGSSDFSYSLDQNGSTFLVTGYSEATWDKGVSGVFVEFDPERGFKGRTSGS